MKDRSFRVEALIVLLDIDQMRVKDKEKEREYGRKHYLKNRVVLLQKQKIYYEKNRDRIAAANKAYKLRNLEKYKIYGNNKYARRSALVNRIKMKPCADCGVQYNPWVMQFDHRPGEEKKFTIGRVKGSRSLENVASEILKCDVVCANCHCERTHRRKDFLVRRKDYVKTSASVI